MHPRERRRDLGEKLITDDAVADFDRGGEALGIGAAVAFDDDAVEAEKDAAVGLAWIHALLEFLKRGAREHIAKPDAQRTTHGGPDVFTDLPCGPLRGLERDVAGE